MSPICSTMVASASGMMVTAAVISMDGSSVSRPNSPNTVLSHWKGRPIQLASRTAVKSTSPAIAATT